MVSRNTILVEAQIDGTQWTPGTLAAIDQAGLVASCSQAAVYLFTGFDPRSVADESTAAANERDWPSDFEVQKLHSETATTLRQRGVEMMSDLIQNEKNGGASAQPAPLSFAFISLPDLLSDDDPTRLAQVLDGCRHDLWMAVPQAFDKDIPCFVVYDDLSANGDQALRAAVSLAQQVQARLLVAHSVDSSSGRGVVEQIQNVMQERLFDTDFRTLDQGTRIAIANGDASDAIHQFVDEHNASLVVISWPDGPIDPKKIGAMLRRLCEQNCSLLLVRTHDSILPVEPV